MPAGGLVVGGVAAIGSGAIGASAASSAQGSALTEEQLAAQQYLSLLVPDPQEQKIILQHYQMTGKMDPRLARAFQQANTEMSKVQTDPALKGAQMSALSSLENEANQGGHTLEQDANLNQLEQRVNAENHGREGAIEERFAERGMGAPGGLSLAAEEQNNQNMTQKENEASLQAAAQAQHNALSALQGEGQLAGQVRGQDWNEKASVAQAQDSINQFNTRMNQGVENANTATENQAQAYNLVEAQRVADQNVGVTNAQEQYNKQLRQQQYGNQLAKAQGAANAMNGVANQYNHIGDTSAAMWGNIGQGALKAGVGAGKLYGNNASDTTGDTNPNEATQREKDTAGTGW